MFRKSALKLLLNNFIQITAQPKIPDLNIFCDFFVIKIGYAWVEIQRFFLFWESLPILGWNKNFKNSFISMRTFDSQKSDKILSSNYNLDCNETSFKKYVRAWENIKSKVLGKLHGKILWKHGCIIGSKGLIFLAK